MKNIEWTDDPKTSSGNISSVFAFSWFKTFWSCFTQYGRYKIVDNSSIFFFFFKVCLWPVFKYVHHPQGRVANVFLGFFFPQGRESQTSVQLGREKILDSTEIIARYILEHSEPAGFDGLPWIRWCCPHRSMLAINNSGKVEVRKLAVVLYHVDFIWPCWATIFDS